MDSDDSDDNDDDEDTDDPANLSGHRQFVITGLARPSFNTQLRFTYRLLVIACCRG